MSRSFRFTFDELAALTLQRTADTLGRPVAELTPCSFEISAEADGSFSGVVTIRTDREPVEPAAFEPGPAR